MKKLNLTVVLIFLSVFTSFAQELTQTIRGTVLDKDSKMPLIGATIVLLETSPPVGTITNIDGEFKLENVPIGRQGINVSYVGYNSVKLNNLMLSSGKEVVLNIELKEKVFTTKEVVITAKQDKNKASNKMATVSARSFSVEETERFAGSLGDPSRMVANYAGVMMANDSRNDIIIRGNTPSGLLWRLDGIEIPNPNHFGSFGTTGGPVSMLNNNLLTNSDFFTSAFPAEFGNAISGVFDLKMRAGNNQKREYVGQIGFNGFELGVEGPFTKKNKASYLANYRYSTLDVFHKLGIDVGVGEAVPQYQDLTFKLNFPGTKIGNFSLIGMGGISYIELHDSQKAKADDNSGDSNYDYGGVDLDYGSDMGIIGLSNVYFFNSTTRLRSNVSILANRATTYIDSLKFDSIGDLLPNSNYQFYASEGTEVKYSLNTHITKKFSSKDNATTGIYFDLYQVNYSDSVLDSDSSTTQFITSLNIKGNVSLLRYYAQWQHNFSEKLTLNSGVYSHYIFLNDEISVEPRLGLKYSFSNSQSLSFGYGLHSIMQPRIYYFIQTRLADGSYIKTNEDVKMTKSNQFVIAYDKLFSEEIRFKTEVYYQSLFNAPVSKEYPEYSALNSGDDFYSPIPDSMLNEGTGTNYGLELTFEKFFSKGYYFLTTFSYFESKYKGYSGTERNTAFNGNYVLNVLGGYEFKLSEKNRLTVDFKTVYAGGKRYIPIDLEASILENYVEYKWEDAFENKFDDYFRADLRIGFKTNGKRINQEWALDLQNLTGHENIYKQSYNPRTKSITSDYQQGFFPMMLWRIQF